MKKVIGILIILVFISATLVVIFRAYIPSNNSEPKLELNTKDVSQKEKNKIINKVKTLKTSNGLYYSGLLNKEPDLYTTY
uniref:hypothetical protein n=1 Tax=Priestia megaterium TaxID=1404 RepID=UPI003100C2B0